MDTTHPSSVPALTELFAQYLQSQVTAHEAGLGFAEPGGEVVPYEAVPAQPIDPRLAWTETLAVLPYLNPKVATQDWLTPSDWPALVAGHEPVMALALVATTILGFALKATFGLRPTPGIERQ